MTTGWYPISSEWSWIGAEWYVNTTEVREFTRTRTQKSTTTECSKDVEMQWLDLS